MGARGCLEFAGNDRSPSHRPQILARILFLHQNFPAQYLHLAQALRDRGDTVVAIGMEKAQELKGIPLHRYDPLPRDGVPACHHLVADSQTKILRGTAVAHTILRLLGEGFEPDLVIGHPGWGEMLAVADILPGVPVIHHQEFVYNLTGADYGFDKEFHHPTWIDHTSLRIRRNFQLLALDTFACATTSTWWQWSSIPAAYRDRVVVVHEGIDTDRITATSGPVETSEISLARDGVVLRPGDEVLTFVSRNLEPCRGFHIFMRMLPLLQQLRPEARVIVVGKDGKGYGSAPPGEKDWRTFMMKEVGMKLDTKRIHFVGHVPHSVLHRLLRISSCHVYFTVPFVLSWSLLEAMACGCLVVGSATPPVQEVIDDGMNGLLVDFFDHENLAKTVARVLADPKAYDPLRQAARQTVVDHYDLKRICLPKLIQTADRLLQGQPIDDLLQEPPSGLRHILM
jgi:glycosyltransferase involved in cell wall biosynthesis